MEHRWRQRCRGIRDLPTASPTRFTANTEAASSKTTASSARGLPRPRSRSSSSRAARGTGSERSITRKTGRQGQPRPDVKHVQASIWADSDQAWVAIPDTDKATELERWVRSVLGMGPESFRSAVLLRQGEADKLLNARANQRFQILAGLIDLRAYQNLEQLATGRRKAADTEVGLLDQQLAHVEHVTDEQVAEVASLLTTAEGAVETAGRERLQADRRCQGAQRHAELQTRRSELLQRKAELDTIVNDAVNIRSRAAEQNQVEKTIKPVTAALADLDEAAAAAAAADDALTRFEAIDLAALESAAAVAATSQEDLDEELERLNEYATQLASVLARANEVRRCRVEQDARAQVLAKTGEPAQLRTQAERLARDLEATRAKIPIWNPTTARRLTAAASRRAGCSRLSGGSRPLTILLKSRHAAAAANPSRLSTSNASVGTQTPNSKKPPPRLRPTRSRSKNWRAPGLARRPWPMTSTANPVQPTGLQTPPRPPGENSTTPPARSRRRSQPPRRAAVRQRRRTW